MYYRKRETKQSIRVNVRITSLLTAAWQVQNKYISAKYKREVEQIKLEEEKIAVKLWNKWKTKKGKINYHQLYSVVMECCDWLVGSLSALTRSTKSQKSTSKAACGFDKTSKKGGKRSEDNNWCLQMHRVIRNTWRVIIFSNVFFFLYPEVIRLVSKCRSDM